MMGWPLPQDFNEAVQNPAISFMDMDLNTGQAVVGPSGLPLPRSGNFADVYQIRAANGRDWAVKCFTRPVTGLEQRYRQVDEALKRAGLPFTIGFAFLNQGVMVHGAWHPALKMEWVDGLQLNQAVRVQAGNPKVLDALVQMWSRLCKRLRDAGIAHADLQHGNVLLVAGSKAGSYSLKLIDYDGMFTPSLANTPSGESGHPNYQHPQRAAKQIYSPDLDRFPHLVIATAMKGLAVCGAKLWERYDTGDNLLFTESDFQAPASSSLMKELWASNDPGLQALVGHLAIACGKPLPQTPWLDQIAPEGAPVPLTPEQARLAATALGLAPPARANVVPVAPVEYGVELVGPLPQSPPKSAFSGLHDSEELVPVEIAPRRREMASRASRRSSMAPLAIGGGVLALALIVVAAVAFSGGGKKDETAQQKPDDDKEKEKPKPPPKKEERPKPPDPTPPDPVPPRKERPAPPMPEPTGFNFDPANVPELKSRWVATTTGNAANASFTANGLYVIATDGGSPTQVRVIAATSGTAQASFTEGETNLVDYACLADGNVASWHLDQPFALVWNPATGKKMSRLPVRMPADGPGPKLFDVSPDGRYVVAGRGMSPKSTDLGLIVLSDAETGKEILSVPVRHPRFRFHNDQFILADVEQLQFYRLPGGQPGRSAKFGNVSRTGRMLGCTADGSLVLHPGSGDPQLIDCRTGGVLAVFPPRFASSQGAISDDGRLAAAISPPNRTSGEPMAHLEVLDVAARKLIGRFILGQAPDVSSIAFAPDNSALVISRSGRRVQAIDLPRDVVAVLPKMKNPDPMPLPKPPDPTPMPKPKDPPPNVERVAVPEAAVIEKAEMKLHTLFKEEYARKAPADRRALAIKLIGLADGEAEDAALRYAMYRDARDFAIEIFETPLALQSLDGVLKHFEVDADAMRIETLDKIQKTAGNNTALKNVAEAALAAGDNAIAGDRFAAALKFAQVATEAVKRGNPAGTLREEVDALNARAQKGAEAFKPIQKALEALQENPGNRDAAYTVGHYRCFQQGRWEEGIRNLAAGAFGDMRTAASLDAAAPRPGPGDVRVAEAWWQVSQTAVDALEKQGSLHRARHWYARSLAGLAGDARTQAESRLALAINGTDYRPGLLAEFTAKVPAVLKDQKARLDPVLDFNAGEFKGKDAAGTATDLTAKWSGSLLAPRPGRFRIAIAATDPVIVRLDGRIVIDTHPKGARREAMLPLPDRPVLIEVTFKCINTEKHAVKLLWSLPGADAEELIPAESLLHDKKVESALGKSP